MTDLIGLAGYARTGKDTVAGLLAGFGFGRVAFADPLRAALYRLNPSVFAQGVGRHVPVADLVDEFGWEAAKAHPEVRHLLQRLGTEAIKPLFGDDCWTRVALGCLSGRTVITDVRFPVEADAIHAAGGLVIRVHRRGFGPVNGHFSEVALDGWRGYDWHIWNNGDLAALDAQVAALAA